MNDDSRRVLIWGAGAIGGTIGAYLVRGGCDVTFVDVDASHARAINERGLSITGPFGDFNVGAPACTPEQLEGHWNTVLLCTKAQHTAQAAQALAPHLRPDGVVVSIQNGLNPLILNEHIPPGQVLGSFVNFGADYLEPGVVQYGGRGVVVIGEQDGQLTERARQLHQILQHFEPAAILTPNVFGYLWSKLAYGALLFATAVTNDSIADALEQPEDRAMYTELGREVMRVALAHGIVPEAFNGFDPAAFLPDASGGAAQASLDEMVAFNRRSAKTHSGIWRDLAVRKRTTEVDAQLGWVVHFGRQHGIPTPLNARLITQIHEIEAGTRELGRGNLAELRALLAGEESR